MYCTLQRWPCTLQDANSRALASDYCANSVLRLRPKSTGSGSATLCAIHHIYSRALSSDHVHCSALIAEHWQVTMCSALQRVYCLALANGHVSYIAQTAEHWPLTMCPTKRSQLSTDQWPCALQRADSWALTSDHVPYKELTAEHWPVTMCPIKELTAEHWPVTMCPTERWQLSQAHKLTSYGKPFRLLLQWIIKLFCFNL